MDPQTPIALSPAGLDEDTLDGLKSLIAANEGSHEILSEAAKQVEDPEVQTLFRNIADTRQRQAGALRDFVQLNYEKAPEDGTLGDQIREQWVKFRGALNGGDPYVLLIEAERAEDRIKDAYKDVIEKTAGSPVNDVLHHQLRAVKTQHDAVVMARDNAKRAK